MLLSHVSLSVGILNPLASPVMKPGDRERHNEKDQPFYPRDASATAAADTISHQQQQQQHHGAYDYYGASRNDASYARPAEQETQKRREPSMGRAVSRPVSRDDGVQRQGTTIQYHTFMLLYVLVSFWISTSAHLPCACTRPESALHFMHGMSSFQPRRAITGHAVSPDWCASRAGDGGEGEARYSLSTRHVSFVPFLWVCKMVFRIRSRLAEKHLLLSNGLRITCSDCKQTEQVF